jgi:hypothetical protein
MSEVHPKVLITADKKLVAEQDFGGMYAGLLAFDPEPSGPLPPITYKGLKMPLSVWQRAVQFMLWTYDDYKGESQGRFVYAQAKGWGFVVLPQNKRAGLSTTEILNHPSRQPIVSWMNRVGCDFLGTLHHHCSAGAFQSGTDKNDEMTQMGLHITLGNLNSSTMTIHMRFVLRGIQYEVKPEEWFDFPAELLTKHPSKDIKFPEYFKRMVISGYPTTTTYAGGYTGSSHGGEGYTYQGSYHGSTGSGYQGSRDWSGSSYTSLPNSITQWKNIVTALIEAVDTEKNIASYNPSGSKDKLNLLHLMLDLVSKLANGGMYSPVDSSVVEMDDIEPHWLFKFLAEAAARPKSASFELRRFSEENKIMLSKLSEQAIFLLPSKTTNPMFMHKSFEPSSTYLAAQKAMAELSHPAKKTKARHLIGGDIECPACKGIGVLQDEAGIWSTTCADCNGEGVITPTAIREEDVVPVPCPICALNKDREAYKAMQCWACKGTGTSKLHVPCEACETKGCDLCAHLGYHHFKSVIAQANAKRVAQLKKEKKPSEEVESHNDTVCPHCKGARRVDGVACVMCGGTGINEETVECPQCHGAQCAFCNFSGRKLKEAQLVGA